MFAVGLTGGIGAGKSAVADLLVERGAVLVDADLVARQVVAPDGPAYGPLVERFGHGIVAPDGTIDRPALAAMAFHDPQALADLNAITHPAIGLEMVQRRHALTRSDPDALVVLAIPLLTAAHRDTLALDAVVVVDCPVETAVARLTGRRGMDRTDAEARVAAQISREERLRGVDFVVDNSGSLEQLTEEVDRLWAWIAARRAAGTRSGPTG